MDTSRPDAETDVVVVGGGAAGCVVAARLAEDGSRSVILIEAGPDLRASIPDGLRDGWGMSRDHGWGYESELDDRGQVEPIHRGRLLGGTSWVTRFAVRGSPADFDAWAALGNAGWASADAYLPAGRTPANLSIRADSPTAEIVFDGDRAVGVRLLDGSIVRGRRMVLCAGTYGSPAILMRSGIGPASHLRAMGIPVRVD